ncbi:MAG: hypothetical protein EOO38_31965, partial [Cytophagaceae bacterium]
HARSEAGEGGARAPYPNTDRDDCAAWIAVDRPADKGAHQAIGHRQRDAEDQPHLRIAELERQLPASNIISLDPRGSRKL